MTKQACRRILPIIDDEIETYEIGAIGLGRRRVGDGTEGEAEGTVMERIFRIEIKASERREGFTLPLGAGLGVPFAGFEEVPGN